MSNYEDLEEIKLRSVDRCANPMKHRRGMPPIGPYRVNSQAFCRPCLADRLALQPVRVRYQSPKVEFKNPNPIGTCESAHSTHRAAEVTLDGVLLCWDCADARLIDRDRWKGPDPDPYLLALYRPVRTLARFPASR